MKQKIAILGGGESGTWAAILAAQKGYDVFLSDRGKIQEVYRSLLEEEDIDYEEGNHTLKKILSADIVVKSPGIPKESNLIKQIKKAGIPILSEIEWAYRFQSKKIVGITGSNGKTTTTRLITYMLNTCGIKAMAAGNVGDSLSRCVADSEMAEILVVELSSFQLEDIDRFKSDVSVLLNISPDHLDRYQGDIRLYAQAKLNLVRNNTAGDLIIYNADDPYFTNASTIKDSKANLLPLRISTWDEEGFQDNQGHHFHTSGSVLKGRHNAFNAACAAAVAFHLGGNKASIQRAIDTFVNESHRLEFVGEFDDIQYINDSKATNVDSVYYALEAMNRPVIWIVGGQDKGNDYEQLSELVKNKVKGIVALGIDNSKIIDFFKGYNIPLFDTDSMEKAVNQSDAMTSPGDVVLLSPACASFDLFNNYKHRGDLFREIVCRKKNI
jgi:UDP-N-acetylmuramoylalanine--D-glutamate ligase